MAAAFRAATDWPVTKPSQGAAKIVNARPAVISLDLEAGEGIPVVRVATRLQAPGYVRPDLLLRSLLPSFDFDSRLLQSRQAGARRDVPHVHRPVAATCWYCDSGIGLGFVFRYGSTNRWLSAKNFRAASGDELPIENPCACPSYRMFSYFFPADKIAFVGDTLFSIGCGRVIEGNPEMMWHSLVKLRELPDDTGRFLGSLGIGETKARIAGTPEKEPDGKELPGWGLAIDITGDCKFTPADKALKIEIPGKFHSLEPDANHVNAPRVMAPVEGDFVVTVKVAGVFTAGGKTTNPNPRGLPYNGAGILAQNGSNGTATVTGTTITNSSTGNIVIEPGSSFVITVN